MKIELFPYANIALKKKILITVHHLESFDLRNYWLIFRLKFRWHKKMWKKIYVTLKTYLCHLQKLPGKFKKMFADFETLMDPSRNHRVYRLSVSKLTPPIIPFMPLLMKGSHPLCVLTKTDSSSTTECVILKAVSFFKGLRRQKLFLPQRFCKKLSIELQVIPKKKVLK